MTTTDGFERWLEAEPPSPGARRITRRQLLRGAGRGAAGLAAASFLASCSSGGSSGSPSPSGAETSMPPLAHELSVAQWPLYIDRARGGHRPTLEAFQKETGIQVDYREVINDNEEFFAKLVPQFQAGQPTGWDIIALSDWVVTRMDRGGWLERLNWDLLPTARRNMLSAFRDPIFDPGNAHSVPWQGGVTGVAYHPDKVPGGKIESFGDLWNEALAGHVGMLTEMVDSMSLTLLLLGVEPVEATLDDAERAQAKLIEQRDAGIVRDYYGQDYIEALTAGDTWASMAWSGDVFYNKYLGGAPDLEFVVPIEGGMIWTGPLEIPQKAAHPTDAHAFMDFYYRPEIAAQVTDWVLYMTPVKGVQEIMADKARKMSGANARYYETLSTSPLLFPPEDPASANLHQYKALSEDEFQRYNDLFSSVVSS
jgi:spermidine/putrescine transport system substrate-binding protein